MDASTATETISDALSRIEKQIDNIKEVASQADDVRTSVDELSKVLEDAQRDAASIGTTLQKATELSGEIESDHTTASDLKTKIDDVHTAVTASETKIKTIEDNSEQWRAKLNDWETRVEKTIEGANASRSQNEKTITDWEERLTEINKRIQEQFRLTASGALAEAFEKKITSLSWWYGVWMGLAIVSYVGAALVGAAIVASLVPTPADQNANAATQASEWIGLTSKLFTAVPVGFLVWFLTIQASKARTELQSYRFKASVASTFDAYRAVVEEVEEKKLSDDYAVFIRETISSIYTPPDPDMEDAVPQEKAMKKWSEMFGRIVKASRGET